MNKMTKPDMAALIQQHRIESEAAFSAAKKNLEQSGSRDEDGYPTQAAVDVISTWYDPTYSNKSVHDLFDFIKSIWYMASYGWHEEIVAHPFRDRQQVRQLQVSTVGWSGNEAIIKALGNNESVWNSVWVQSRRGGHYIFQIDLDDSEQED